MLTAPPGTRPRLVWAVWMGMDVAPTQPLLCFVAEHRRRPGTLLEYIDEAPGVELREVGPSLTAVRKAGGPIAIWEFCPVCEQRDFRLIKRGPLWLACQGCWTCFPLGLYPEDAVTWPT